MYVHWKIDRKNNQKRTSQCTPVYNHPERTGIWRKWKRTTKKMFETLTVLNVLYCNLMSWVFVLLHWPWSCQRWQEHRTSRWGDCPGGSAESGPGWSDSRSSCSAAWGAELEVGHPSPLETWGWQKERESTKVFIFSVNATNILSQKIWAKKCSHCRADLTFASLFYIITPVPSKEQNITSL